MPNRRGPPRKVRGARIRYVEEDERGGAGRRSKAYGWGPVSVQRVAKDKESQDESNGGGALVRT